MKLWGVSMVRNEEDIVEAFVRHNLSLLDGLIVVDHGSADRTLAILNVLCAERMRLVVLRSEAVGYLQAEITTTAARKPSRAATRTRRSRWTPTSSSASRRAALERALAAIPPGHHGWIAWPTYVPPLEGAPGGIVAALRAARRALVKFPGLLELSSKVVLTRHFAQDPSATITMGNHDVLLGRHQVTSPRMPHVEIPEAVVEVCHVPVRSPAQFVENTTIKRRRRRRTRLSDRQRDPRLRSTRSATTAR